MGRWTIEDVIDCEALIARSKAALRAGASPSALRAGDLAACGDAVADADDGIALLAWVRGHRARDGDLPGRRLVRWPSHVAWAAAAGGVLLCLSLHPWGAFRSGAGAINVFWLIGVFVAAPLALLLLSVTAALGGGLPGIGALLRLLGFAQEGLRRLLAWLMHFQRFEHLDSGSWERAIENLQLGRNRRLWLGTLATALQIGAIAYGLTALLVLLFVLLFTRQDFTWGTTLGLDAGLVVRLFGWPWQGVAPDAVPGAAVVAATRQGSGMVAAGIADQARATWGRFLLATIGIWTVLPRLLILIVLHVQRRLWLRQFPRRIAGVVDYREVLHRLRPAGRVFDGDAREPAEAERTASTVAAGDASSEPAPALAVRWDEADVTDAALTDTLGPAAGLVIEGVVDAGAGTSLDADAAALDAAAATDRAVALCVDAAEQPLAGVGRFLIDLRQRVGRSRSLHVLLVGASDERHRREWEACANRIGGEWTVQQVGDAS